MRGLAALRIPASSIHRPSRLATCFVVSRPPCLVAKSGTVVLAPAIDRIATVPEGGALDPVSLAPRRQLADSGCFARDTYRSVGRTERWRAFRCATSGAAR